MKNILLLDFGASKFKSALFSLKNGQITHFKSQKAILPAVCKGMRYEISWKKIKQLFNKTVDNYTQLSKLDGILLCSEMHGFLLADMTGNPITDYISWKDERSLEVFNEETSFDYLTKKLNGIFKEKTGLSPKPCYPAYNLISLAREGNIKSDVKILTLPELFTEYPGNKNISHITMGAGLGIYDIFRKKTISEFIDLFHNITGYKLYLNEILEEPSICGHIKVKGRNIPIYSAFGDQQTSILGAQNIPNQTISINMGTGSQISEIVQEKDCDKTDYRPFFDHQFIKTITHIPSGRVLNEFLLALNGFKPSQHFEKYIWDKINTLSLEDLDRGSMQFNLNIFSSSWNYSEGEKGFINNIHCSSFNITNYLASLLKSYLRQYTHALSFFNTKNKKIILSGGIPSKIPIISSWIKRETGLEIIVNTHSIDETILGLSKIIQKTAE